ncbi:MAG: fibronectin type III domain-containing protein [Clostridia bacterium]|nr:fibronectin type III domain-containing protein [Clostridia bacterium]MBO7318651.1 fibronectin type III domain-containing protein [Clostridia bacterium]
MKKITKLLSLLLACVIAFSTVSMAAENVAEETTATQEEATTRVEETTTQAEETTTAQEETTKVEEPETTVPEEETTADPEEETTTTPEEETTEKAEIALPKVPERFDADYWYDSKILFSWSSVEEADGYALYQKMKGDWVLIAEPESSTFNMGGFIFNSIYDFAMKSYIEVDGVKYYSEDQVECSVKTSPYIGQLMPRLESTKEGMRVYWYVADGLSGCRVYIEKNNKWVKLASVPTNGEEIQEYIYKDVKVGESYTFAIKPYAKGTEGTVFGMLLDVTGTHKDFTKAEIKSKSATSSSVTLKWGAIDGASGYRVYVYKDGKWKYYTGIKTETYTVKDLKDATKYKFKIRAYFKGSGKTTWGAYSDEVSVTTKGKTVKASRISKLKKYFTDGDWSVKITGLDDGVYGKLDYTFAVKGQKIFARYDYKNNKNIRDFEYLIDFKTETVNVIFDDNKTYVVLKEEEAEAAAYSIVMMGAILDMSSAKGVTAKTTTYSGKRAVAEIYTDKDLETKKTYYFVNDKIKALKLTYADGSTETFKISKINDTPSSSVFKIPSGYKRAFF